MLTFLLLATIRTTPEPAFAAFAAFNRAHPVYTVDVLANGVAKCRLTIHRPDLMRFEVNLPGYSYVLVRAGQRGFEMSPSQKIYAQCWVGPKLFQLESQISDEALDVLPAMLLADDLRPMVDADKVTTTTIPGGWRIKCELPVSSGDINMEVDKSGRLTEYELNLKQIGGIVRRTYAMSNFRLGTDASYDMEPPLGFSNYYLPAYDLPIPAATSLPEGRWKKSGGASVSLRSQLGSGKTLLAILDMNEGPSIRASHRLGELRASLKGTARILVLTNSATPLKTDSLVSADGKSFAALAAAGTPLYYLVEKERVLRVWLGDDDATRPSQVKDIVDACSKQ